MDEVSRAAVPASETEGRYSNYFKVGYNAFEFLLEFGQMYVESKGEAIHSRIITTPSYAKALAELLAVSLAEYERQFGSIPSREE